MRTEIGELRKDIAKLTRDRAVPKAQVGGGRTTARSGGGGGGSGGVYGQATVATRRRWPVGRYGSSEESKAAEEFVARARRSRNYGRDRS
jgi:hypothetical protein